MKNKKIIAAFACVLILCFLLGVFNLARFFGDDADEESGNDRLIGVFLTTEDLDLRNMEAYLNDHAEELLSSGEMDGTDAYQERCYATLTKTEGGTEYVFEGVDGIPYFSALYSGETGSYYGNSGGEEISDAHMSINSTDGGDSQLLEGTVYLSTAGQTDIFYFNPVYQMADGTVYLTAGQGVSYGGKQTPGVSGSHQLKEETTVTENGETVKVSTEVKLTIDYMDAPTAVTVLQMDSENQELAQSHYIPGSLPETLVVQPEAAYVIVQTEAVDADGGETVTRTLYQKGDETLSAFFCREDGVCIKQNCEITWNR